MKRRKQYLHDPTRPIPKTTAWRLNPDVVLPTDDFNSPKRRKAYYRDSACPVPRSTLWKLNSTELTDDNENYVRDAEHGEEDDRSSSDRGSSGGSDKSICNQVIRIIFYMH